MNTTILREIPDNRDAESLVDYTRYCGAADPEKGTNCTRKPGHAGAHRSWTIAWTDEDGLIPFPSDDERAAQAAQDDADAEQAAADWLTAHPEVSDAAPTWADEFTVDFDRGGLVQTGASRFFGLYELVQSGAYQGGEIRPAESLTIWHPHDACPSFATPREAAAFARNRALELLTLAATLEVEEAQA